MEGAMGNTTGNIIGHQLQNAQKKQKMHQKKAANIKVSSEVRRKVREVIKEAIGSKRAWEEYVAKSAEKIIKSDKKLSKLVDTLKKQQEQLLKKAVQTVKSKFKVPGIDYKIDDKITNEEGIIKASLHFVPKGNQKGKNAYNFKGVHIAFDETNKPAFFKDDDFEAFLTKHMREEIATSIRGAFITIQDKYFSKMVQASKTVDQLNTYMDEIERRVNKLLSDMPMIDVKVLRTLLRSKYREAPTKH